MEPPQKRARLGYAPYDDDDDDEICMAPDEFRAKQDPGYQLDKSRAKAAFKLKSTFEHIFEKYEKDFTDIGDEIDLNTGEIVVDNGHLRSLNDKAEGGPDVQNDRQPELAARPQSEADSLEEEERILHGRKKEDTSKAIVSRPPLVPQARPAAGAWGGMSSLLGGSHRLSNLFTPRLSFMEQPLSFGPFGRSVNDLVEPAWRVPDIPMQRVPTSFAQQFRRRSPPSGPVVRKPLPIALHKAAANDSDSDSDDILLGVSRSKLPSGVEPQPNRSLPADNEGGATFRHVEEILDSNGTVEPKNDDIRAPQKAHGEKIAPAKRGRKRKINSSPNHDSQVVKATSQPPHIAPRKPPGGQPVAGNAAPTSKPAVPSRPTKDREDLRRRLPTPEPELELESDSEPPTARRCPSVELDARRSQNEGASRSDPDETRRKATQKRSRKKSKPTDAQAGSSSDQDTSRPIKQKSLVGGTSGSSLAGERDMPTHSAKEQLVIEIVERRPTPPPVIRSDSWEGTPSRESEMDSSQHELQAPSTEQSQLEVDGAASPSCTVVVPDSQRNPQQLPQLDSTSRQTPQKDAPETFSRNVLDPSYAFSDDDDRPVPRKPINRGGSEKGRPKEKQNAGGAKVQVSEASERPATDSSIDDEIIPSTVPEISNGNTPSKNPKEALSHAKTPEEGSVSAKKHSIAIRYSRKNKKPAKETPKADKTDAPQGKISGSVSPRKRHSPEPETPQARVHRKSPTSNPPPSKDGITSLVSDCDEDELSLGPDAFTPSGSRRASFPREQPRSAHSASASMRKSTLKRSFLFGKPRTPASAVSAKRRPSLTGSGLDFSPPRREKRVGGGGEGGVGGVHSSPTGSLVQTPNGTMRRCGVAGFRCDRDFCFMCL